MTYRSVMTNKLEIRVRKLLYFYKINLVFRLNNRPAISTF